MEASIDENTRRGMAQHDAVRAARVAIGSLEAVKDYTRDVGWETRLDSFWRDVSYAARTLRRSPAFSAVAVLTLALGIGANTAIFSVINAVMLRPLRVERPDELITSGGCFRRQRGACFLLLGLPPVCRRGRPSRRGNRGVDRSPRCRHDRRSARAGRPQMGFRKLLHDAGSAGFYRPDSPAFGRSASPRRGGRRAQRRILDAAVRSRSLSYRPQAEPHGDDLYHHRGGAARVLRRNRR